MDDRAFTHNCTHAIAKLLAEADTCALVCVVIATHSAILQVDSSTMVIGPPSPTPDILVELAHRLRPAIEGVARELARDTGQQFERRFDLEGALGDREPS